MSTWQLCSSYPTWHWTNTIQTPKSPLPNHFGRRWLLVLIHINAPKKSPPPFFLACFCWRFLSGTTTKKKRWTMVPTCSACSSNQLGSSARSSQKIAEPRASRPRCWPLAVGVFLGGAVVVVVVVAWFLPIESSLEKTKENSRNHRKKIQAIVT